MGDVRSYRPSDDQRAARSTFWRSYEGDGPVDVELALEHCGDSQVASWWPEKGFQDWFLNKDSFGQRAELIAEKALSKLEYILDTEADTDKLLRAARMAMELAKKFPAKAVDTPDKFLDDAITKMNKEQLRAYLQRTAPKLLQAPAVVTIEATSTDKE